MKLLPFGIGNPLGKIEPPDFPKINLSFDGGVIQGRESRREILELLLKVEVIETDCLAVTEEEASEADKDDFIRLKKSTYNTIAQTKTLLRQHHEIQTQKGNTVEAIQKASKVTELVQLLEQNYLKLKEIFKKQSKQKGTTKISDVELDARFKELQIIKRQIEQCKALKHNPSQFAEDEIVSLTDFVGQMREQGIEMPKMPQRDLLDTEKEALDRWGQRDKQLDQGLEEVGDVVTRLGEIAVNIGEKAEQQARVVQALNLQANEASEELVQMNDSIKSLLNKGGKGANMCCKLVLALALTGQLAYLINVVVNIATAEPAVEATEG